MNQLGVTKFYSLKTSVVTLCCFLVAAGTIKPPTANAQSDWVAMPDMPVEKWEPATVVYQGKWYLFGGYTEGVKSSKLSYFFDPADGSWTRIQDLPSAISHVNLVLDGNRVWFAGGFKDGYKDHIIAEVWNYNFELDRYTVAQIFDLPRHYVIVGFS